MNAKRICPDEASAVDFHQNVAAIAYHAPKDYYERHSGALEGESGMLLYFVDCADVFTNASHDVEDCWMKADWYLAIEAFVDELGKSDGVPSRHDLYEMATRTIESARDGGGA
jgi:hypothetical protein